MLVSGVTCWTISFRKPRLLIFAALGALSCSSPSAEPTSQPAANTATDSGVPPQAIADSGALPVGGGTGGGGTSSGNPLLTRTGDFSAVIDRPAVVGTIDIPDARPRSLGLFKTANLLLVHDTITESLLKFDTQTLQQVGTIPIELGDWSNLVVVEEFAKVYIGDKIVNLDTDTVQTVETEQVYDWVYDPMLERVYGKGTSEVVRVDVATDALTVLDIEAPGQYSDLFVDPDTSELYIGDWGSRFLRIWDGNTLELLESIPDLGALGYAFNPLENKVYGGFCQNTGDVQLASDFCIYDRDDGSIVRFTAIDDTFTVGNDATRFTFNGFANRMYSTSEVNAVTTLIDGETDDWLNVPFPGGSEVHVRQTTGNAYYVQAGHLSDVPGASQASRILVMDPHYHQIIADIDVARVPLEQSGFVGSSVAIDEDEGLLYISADDEDGMITVVQDSACSCDNGAACGSLRCDIGNGCGIDEVPCDDGWCIHEDYVCNGPEHCLNGEDEQQCPPEPR